MDLPHVFVLVVTMGLIVKVNIDQLTS